MCRIFAYCRVSHIERNTENQIIAIRSAGYDIEPARVVEETISGTVPALERPKFATLVNHKMEAGDMLVVLKLDRLGRNNIDIQQTVNTLQQRGIKIVCLDLPVADLSSAEGKMMLQMFSAFAEFERNRIAERSKEGQNRARAEGKKIGRPPATERRAEVQTCKAEGLSQSQTARRLDCSIRTVANHWNI